MSNKLYDRLKVLALVALPALVGFLNVVLPVWGCAEWLCTAIVTTVTALSTFLGALLCVNSLEYQMVIKDLLDAEPAVSVHDDDKEEK